jgi:uncharacterized protein (DUF1330 family)
VTVYVIVQLRFTDRSRYDRYQARFMDDAEYAGISKDRRAGAETTSFLVRGLS